MIAQFLGDATVQEILIRTICVLAVAEGIRIAYRILMYSLKKKSKEVIKKQSETLGVFVNMLVATWMAYIFSENKDMMFVISEGLFYGFGTIFVHWLLMKWLDIKIYRGKL